MTVGPGGWVVRILECKYCQCSASQCGAGLLDGGDGINVNGGDGGDGGSNCDGGDGKKQFPFPRLAS